MVVFDQLDESVSRLTRFNDSIDFLKVGHLIKHVTILIELLVSDLLVQLESLRNGHVFRVKREQLQKLLL